MAKRLVNIRIEDDLLAAFDAWAEARGWSRTRAIERLMAYNALGEAEVAATIRRNPATVIDAGTQDAIKNDVADRATSRRDVTPRLKKSKP